MLTGLTLGGIIHIFLLNLLHSDASPVPAGAPLGGVCRVGHAAGVRGGGRPQDGVGGRALGAAQVPRVIRQGAPKRG